MQAFDFHQVKLLPGKLRDTVTEMAAFYRAMRGRKGQRVIVRMAETMNPDGSGTIRPIVPTWSAWTLAGGPQPEVFRHQFSYAAGRWVQVEVVTIEPDDPELPQLLAVRGHFVTTTARDAGFFACSDQMYNKIHDLVLKAVESNLNHVHTDCPTVEKLDWLEASQQMAPSIMFSKDVDALRNAPGRSEPSARGRRRPLRDQRVLVTGSLIHIRAIQAVYKHWEDNSCCLFSFDCPFCIIRFESK